MRPTEVVLLVCALLVVPAPSLAAADPDGDTSIVRLHVVTDAGAADGTAVLIRRESHGTDVVLYFLTSAHLFRSPEEEPPPRMQAVQVFLDDDRALDIRREDTFVPGGSLLDVAVLRATMAATTIVARRPIFEPPSIGDVFLISGYDRNGAAATVVERVRFQSTLFAVGDRDASALVGCVGAPAISQKGVFGVVSECNPGRAPVIALLSMAQSFIDRHIPRATTNTATKPQFDLIDRQITGPLLAGCDATKPGEVDVPLKLGSREWAVDATAAFVNPREVNLGEVTVMQLDDRSVRLRFVVGGVQSPPKPPTHCPQGQALVTVRVNIAVARTPE